jgi:DNA-binding response OmpR family regulator
MNSEKVRILVVDDNDDIRKLIRMTLSYLSAEIREAINGDEAEEILKKELFQIVILDVMMPGKKDGFEVCEDIKKSSETESINVILLSAKGQVVDIEKGMAAGCDAYLVKPFSPLELIEKVEEAIEKNDNGFNVLFDADDTVI